MIKKYNQVTYVYIYLHFHCQCHVLARKRGDPQIIVFLPSLPTNLTL